MTKDAEKFAKDLARKKAGECVRVVVRVRPMSSKEKQDGRIKCTEVNEKNCQIALKNPKSDASEPPKSFTFDQVYGPTAQQKVIYDRTAAGIVDSVLDGYNGTIFAYGQTGTGKTHTMEGLPDPPELRGIIPNAFKHIFSTVDVAKSEDREYFVRASYLEIYNDEVRDLLSKDPKNRLELKESVDSGVYVKDQKYIMVKNVAEIDQVMQTGKKYRSVGATLMNQTSSRSHSIFTIIIETSQLDKATGEKHIRVGKLNLVDLAGSERLAKTGVKGDRALEATKINLSLSALGNVISALVESRSQHIPYRDSKLTRLLQDSLGGNTKTVMIANCGPADYNFDETLSTLRYANRAKNIKNKPKINEDPKDAMLRDMQKEIEMLKQKLENGNYDGEVGPSGRSGGARGNVQDVNALDPKHVEEMREQLAKEAKEEYDKIRIEAEEKVKLEMERREVTEREKDELEKKAFKAAERAHKAAKAKANLQKQLKEMEEKLLKGEEFFNDAVVQEQQLRKAQRELEERKLWAQRVKQVMEEREDDIRLKDERYNSLQEEVDIKTKKLKKVWDKYQNLKSESRDLHNEFQREREDMLETIRELNRQLKLKQLIMDHFVPPEILEKINSRATYSEEDESWSIARLEFSGNLVRPKRTASNKHSRFPESEYARQRKQYDQNPRFKQENTVHLGLDMPERTTQDYDGAAMSQRVDAAVNAALMGDDEEVIEFTAPENLPNPYLNYTQDEKPSSSSRRKKRSSKSSSRSSRPSSASRRGRSNSSGHGREQAESVGSTWLEGEEEFPTARGLVRGRY